jgi:hypothetical protein
MFGLKPGLSLGLEVNGVHNSCRKQMHAIATDNLNKASGNRCQYIATKFHIQFDDNSERGEDGRLATVLRSIYNCGNSLILKSEQL